MKMTMKLTQPTVMAEQELSSKAFIRRIQGVGSNTLVQMHVQDAGSNTLTRQHCHTYSDKNTHTNTHTHTQHTVQIQIPIQGAGVNT